LNLLKDKYNVILLILFSLILFSFNLFELTNYDNVILYIINFCLCFGIYSLIFFRNKNSPETSLKEILLISIFLRVIVIFVNPVTTDDQYRYLWDGRVQSEGVNPYKFSPLELTEVQDDVIYPKVSFPEIRTIYPPVSQIIFFLSNKFFGEQVIGLKFFYLLFEIGILCFLYNSMKLLKINSNYIFLYALSPLIIFEFFINAHIDIVILFFLAGSIYFALKMNMNLSMLFLGFSVLSKVYSIIFLPLFIIYFYKKNRNIKSVSVSLLYFLLSFSHNNFLLRRDFKYLSDDE
jgi:alpha-1,6-mannosyltransferase